jgi:hypothetical protein
MSDLPAPKRPKPGPKKNFSPGMQRMNWIFKCQKAAQELHKKGRISDPDLAERVAQGWDPDIELMVMTLKPDLPDTIKAAILLKMHQDKTISATDRARLEAGFDGPAQIAITIAAYAAGPQARTEIEPPHPPRVGIPALDVVAGDREVPLHRSTPPTPEVKAPKYASYEVVDGVAEPITSDSKPTATADETIDSFGTTVRIRETSNG